LAGLFIVLVKYWDKLILAVSGIEMDSEGYSHRRCLILREDFPEELDELQNPSHRATNQPHKDQHRDRPLGPLQPTLALVLRFDDFGCRPFYFGGSFQHSSIGTALARQMSGVWWGFSGSTETQISLCAGEQFAESTESGYTGSLPTPTAMKP